MKQLTMQWLFRLKSGWTSLKIIRVILGVWVLASAIDTGNGPGLLIGVIFTLFALLTDGVCCAGGSCAIPQNNMNKPLKEERDEKLDTE